MSHPAPHEHPIDPFSEPSQAALPASPAPKPAAQCEVARELGKLGVAAQEDGHFSSPAESTHRAYQNKLAQARLGSSAGLFAALRAKHPTSAEHSLRVALTCSGWAEASHLPSAERDVLEIAALLHDLGKLGVPDRVLSKPGRLQPEEAELMGTHPHHAVEILKSAGAPQPVIDTILTTGAWFDGSYKKIPLAGNQIPVTARMLKIVDAFDSMTTDHVYRPAKPRERALAELFDFAGKQFDPELVKSFAELVGKNQSLVGGRIASHWLAELAKSQSTEWQPTASEESLGSGERRAMTSNRIFEQKLVSNMQDGVIFLDAERQVFQWNTGAERLTGISGKAVSGRVFEPSLLQMSKAEGAKYDDGECPVAEAMRLGVQLSARVGILGRSGRHVMVDLHVYPVYADGGHACGATLLIHDASNETSLEEKCMALHAQTTRDPLTQVANRAEFDRMLEMFIDAHQETELPCSLIMSDIDFFKRINDTYGHQAGDEAIITFASLLKSLCRTGDLVARYGGEEFAVLCADCNNATAAARAEEMRKKLSETTHVTLGNHAITASFGVTELQAGDSPETMLRRADRALLQAKEQGRNQVIQLGGGMVDDEPKKNWFAFKPWSGRSLIDTKLITNVPIELAIEKLRGFICDRAARILKVTEKEVSLEVAESSIGKGNKKELPVTYVVNIKFSQERVERTNTAGLAAGEYAHTSAVVTIQPKRDRDRRKGHVAERARMLLGSLKSYLMAKEASGDTPQAE